MRGRFIVLEGPDGSGTTTHTALLAKRLQDSGVDVLLTQEPTNGPIGSFIRAQLSLGSIPFDALQMLFSADRAWHVAQTILPALESGKTVISDRYMLSTLVYGHALGLDADWLENMNKNFIQPDFLAVALPSFEVCMQRLNKRSTKDMLESQDDLQRRVYEGYKIYAENHHIPLVDTSGSLEQTSDILMALVS